MPPRSRPEDDPTWSLEVVSPGNDFIVRCKVKDENWLENGAVSPAFGAQPEAKAQLTDYLLSGIVKADEVGWHFLYYCKTRAAQEAYNFEFANVLNREWPEVEQTFVFLRSTYVPSATAPVTGLPNTYSAAYTWTFMGESQSRGDEIIDGLFVVVKRLWRDVSQPRTAYTLDPDSGEVVATERRMVPVGTEGSAVNASGQFTEITPLSSLLSIETTRQASGLAGQASNGKATRTLPFRDNYPWPPVLDYIYIQPILSNPGDAFSETVGFSWRPVWKVERFNGPCDGTIVETWFSKMPVLGGDANWQMGPAWAAGTFTVGQYRSHLGESYKSLTNHTGATAPPSDAVNWVVVSPLLPTETPMQGTRIEFTGRDLNIPIEHCLHGALWIRDTQFYAEYAATEELYWPETILGQVSCLPDQGGYLLRCRYVDRPNVKGAGSGLDLSVVSVAATSFVLQWTPQEVASPIEQLLLDVSTDPDFETGFLSGYNAKVITPGTNTPPLQTTVTGATRNSLLYCRVRRGTGTVVTSNTCMVVCKPQAEIALSSSGALADGGTLAFGDAAVGGSTPKTITVTNDGLRTLDGLSVAFSGTNAADFSVGALPAGVDPNGGTETFVVTCSPAAPGSRTAVMTVTSNAPGNPSYVVNLTATGVNPEINVQYSAVDYASGAAVPLAGTTYGGAYTDYTLTIQNTGTGNLSVTAGIVSADGSMTIQTAPTTPVAGSGSTTMVVRFTPTVDGGSSSVLTLTNNDVNESSYVLTLQAEAICTGTLQVTNPLGVVAASGGTFEFGSIEVAVGTRAKTFVLTNVGVGTLDGIAVSSNSGSFVVTALTSTALAAAGTMNVTVTLTTVGSNGVKTGTLTITSSDPAVPSYTMTLTATEVAAGVAEIQAESPVGTVLVDNANTLDFGNVLTTGATATKTLRLRNIGTALMTGLGSTATSGGNSGDFTHPAPTGTMGSDVSQDVTLTFNPTGMGVRSTTLNITSNDADEGTFEVALTGVGIPSNALLTGQSAGVFIGQANATDQLTTASSSVMPEAYSAAISSTGKLAISDRNRNRVLIWNTVPTTSGVPADLVLGQANFTATSAATTSTGLSSPQKLCWHGTNLWVCDTGNNRVLRYTAPSSNGQAASLVLGQTVFTSGTSRSAASFGTQGFSQPNSVFVASGRLYVADTGHNRVIKWNAVPTATNTAGNVVLGQASTTASGSATTAAGMSAPRDVAVTLTGHLMVADTSNNRVLFYAGIPTTTGASASFALFQADLTSAASGTTNSLTNLPYAIAVSSTGHLAVADASNHRALVFYETPTAIGAAHAVLGQADFVSGSAFAGGSAGAAVMSTPTGVCWNGTSLLVSGEAMHRTMKFSPA